MTNLTLSIDEALLQRAREIAVAERTSVNALVREYLERYVDSRARRLAALDALGAVAERAKARSTGTWSRDELHRREPGP